MKQTSLGKGVRRMRAVELRVASCELRVASCELQVASCELQLLVAKTRKMKISSEVNVI